MFWKLPISLRIYVLLQFALLAPVLWAVREQAPQVNWPVAALLLAASAVAGLWKVQLTVLRGLQSLVFAVVGLAYLVQGAPVAMLCAAIGATITHLIGLEDGRRVRYIPQPLYRRLFNASHCALVCGAAALAASAALPLLPPDAPGVLTGLLLFTGLYFLLNTFGVATAIALDQGASPVALWKQHYLFTAPAYFASALVAGGLWLAYRLVGPAALVLLPCFYLVYRGYSAYVGTLRREHEVAEQLSRLYQMEEEANRRKDEFLAMLAHELRNPLASITSAHYLLERRLDHDREGMRHLDIVGRQAHHLKRLVDDLLDVSRINQGKIELRPESADVCTVLKSALDAVRPLVQAKHHALSVRIAADDPLWARVDPVRIEQVFTNVLGNAAKYTESGGRLEVSLQREDTDAVFRVRDNGIGIDPELLPRVFDLFVQADDSLAHSQGGLGIGLTLVKNLVELHEGQVEAYSTGLNQGSEFVVRLPLSAEAALEARSRLALDPNAPRGTVLVIEDNPDAAETMTAMLELWGYSPLAASNGRDGLSRVRSDAPDVAIIDIGLPEMDGYEVARHIRQLAEHKPVLIALTGYGQAEAVESARAAGFDHHVVKPADPEALRRLLEESLTPGVLVS